MKVVSVIAALAAVTGVVASGHHQHEHLHLARRDWTAPNTTAWDDGEDCPDEDPKPTETDCPEDATSTSASSKAAAAATTSKGAAGSSSSSKAAASSTPLACGCSTTVVTWYGDPTCKKYPGRIPYERRTDR